MTNHNNMYNILGKLTALQPEQKPEVNKENVLKTLTEHSNSMVKKLNDKFQETKQLNEYFTFDAGSGKDRGPRDEGPGDELARREKVLGKGGLGKGKPYGKEYKEKDKYGDQYKIAGPKGVLPEGEVDEDMLKPKEKEFAKLAPPKDKVTYADKIAGAKKKTTEGEFQDKVNKSKVPAFQRKAKAQPGDDTWKLSTQDLDDEASQSPTGSAGLAKAKERLGMREGEKVPTKTGYIHKGTYGSDAYGSDDEDDYDEWGNEKKKKAASGDAPKKRGRPAKNKGPERVTANAWKHKGGRKVAEHVRLETVVAETLQEMDDLLITERAKNPYAIGMAQAMKSTGDTPPLKKSTINKAHKIAKKIDESLEAIKHRYGKECKDFSAGGEMDPDLYQALHDHYYDDMPAAVKRGSDTQSWVQDQFMAEMAPIEIELELPSADNELDDLASLAGISGRKPGHDHEVCNLSHEGEYCPVHGLEECGSGMMYEGKKIDQNKDGKNDWEDVKIARMKASTKGKKELEECGVPMAGGVDSEDGMSISTSVDTRTGRKTINISADGETAEQIAQLVKMAGLAAHEEVHGGEQMPMPPQGQPQVGVVHVAEEWANKAEIDYEDVDAITTQGGDLNKKKKQDPKTANKAANPLQEGENEVIERLQALYSVYKVK